VLNPAEEDVSRLTDIRAGQDAAERVLGEFAKNPCVMANDLLSPTAIARFYLYYFHNRAGEMDYPIKANDKRGCGVDTNLLDLLAANTTSMASFTRRHRVAPPFPMRQAFATAARAFAVIDAPTRGIVVPYGEAGQSIIAELASTFTSKDVTLPMQVALLRRAQQYTVNVFSNVLDGLQRQQAIHEVQEDSGIYYLDPRYYHPDTGITVEPSAPLPFCHA